MLEIDHLVPLEEGCRLVPDKVALWGKLDPVSVVRNGTPEMVKQATADAVAAVAAHGRKRFVLSSGCTLAPDTPPQNLSAMVER